MRRGNRYCVAVAFLAVCAGTASADYIVTPLVGGSSTAQVQPGETFNLDIVLTSNVGDQHNSAIVRLVFWTPGLEYDSYVWGTPYETGTIWDDSSPFLTELPTVLGPDTFVDPYYPGVTDIELSNVVPIGQPLFGVGTLVTLVLTVPPCFAPDQTVLIAVDDNDTLDTLVLANGFDIIPSTAGPVFALHVVPEPAGGVLALWSCCLWNRAQRRFRARR